MITNVLGTALKSCCTDPMTGFFRDGYCRTGHGDHGLHTVCAKVSSEFLEFSKSRETTSAPLARNTISPASKDGDLWCLCVRRWMEAYQANLAPKVFLEGCHLSVLEFVDLEVLKEYSSQ